MIEEICGDIVYISGAVIAASIAILIGTLVVWVINAVAKGEW